MKNEYEFLIVIAFAVFIKQVLSPFHSLFRAVTTALAAVFCAYVFTDPIVNFLGWESDKNRLAVAAVLGLTGEHIIRHIIETGKNPDRGLSRTKNAMIKAFEVVNIWTREIDKHQRVKVEDQPEQVKRTEKSEVKDDEV